MAPETKQHYFLVSGEIVYRNDDGLVQSMRVNGIHSSSARQIPAKSLGKIQVMLQMHFHSKYSQSHPKAPEILNAIIDNIVHLGEFTKEEFLAGTEPQEENPSEPTPQS